MASPLWCLWLKMMVKLSLMNKLSLIATHRLTTKLNTRMPILFKASQLKASQLKAAQHA